MSFAVIEWSEMRQRGLIVPSDGASLVKSLRAYIISCFRHSLLSENKITVVCPLLLLLTVISVAKCIGMKCRGSITCKALWSNEMRLIGDSLRLLTVSLATVLRPRFVFHDTFLSFHEHLSRPGHWSGRLIVRSTIANWRGLIRSVRFYD